MKTFNWEINSAQSALALKCEIPLLDILAFRSLSKTDEAKKLFSPSFYKVASEFIWYLEKDFIVPIIQSENIQALDIKFREKSERFYVARMTLNLMFLSQLDQLQDLRNFLSEGQKELISFLDKYSGSLISEKANENLIYSVEKISHINTQFLSLIEENFDLSWSEERLRIVMDIGVQVSNLELCLLSIFFSLRYKSSYSLNRLRIRKLTSIMLESLSEQCRKYADKAYDLLSELYSEKVSRIKVVSNNPRNLKDLIGFISLGGNALEDTEKLYE